MNIAQIIPGKLKSFIRPWYYRFLKPEYYDRPGKICVERYGQFEIAFRENSTDEEVIKQSFENDIFYLGVPEYIPRDFDTIIDVGAHIGTFALLSSNKAANIRVHAIEACKENYNLLRINKALNNSTNVSEHHLALSDTEGKCELYHEYGHWGHSIVESFKQSSEIVRCCTLNTFLEENHIERAAFIKFNCEGAEFPIILGSSSECLQRFDYLLILYHCDLWRSNTEIDLIKHLEFSGFNCTIRNRSKFRGWIVAVNEYISSTKKSK
jgi:FkbM family methyltransferase